MVEVHSSSMANQLLAMVQGVYQEIHLAVLIRIIEPLINKLCEQLLFARALRILGNYLLVNNKLFGKLVSSVPIISDDNLIVIYLGI